MWTGLNSYEATEDIFAEIKSFLYQAKNYFYYVVVYFKEGLNVLDFSSFNYTYPEHVLIIKVSHIFSFMIFTDFDLSVMLVI